MSHNPAMSTTDKIERHYRQQLSALVDGELSADASRLLVRRLAHDEELAGCHERWQLCGDVLRGAVTAPAPLDFAARIRRAIADEHASQVQPVVRPGARWRWAGGAAIAASVAAIALFIAHGRLPGTAASVAETPVYATAAQRPLSSPPRVPAVSKSPADPTPGEPDEVVALAAAVPAAALASSRRGAATRYQHVARSALARQQQTPARTVATATPAAASAASAVAVAPSNPFTHPDATLEARPWPRSDLSRAVESPLNTSVRQSRPGAAFYPFEPAAQTLSNPAPNHPLPVQVPQN